MLGHALNGAGHVGQLADAGRLDDDAVGVILLDDLLQSGAEIAHQRAADAACVQLVDLDAGLLQEAAVDADLAELVLDQNDLLTRKGLLDELLDKGRFTGTKEAGENINLSHNFEMPLSFRKVRSGLFSSQSRGVLAHTNPTLLL